MFFKIPMRNRGTEANPKILCITAKIQTPVDNEPDKIEDEAIAREDKGSELPP
jgi:hypothetical protein